MAAPRVRIGHDFAGRFRVERLLAEGGMGVLYAVTHLATGKRCALKVLNAEGCFDEDVRKRFLDEAHNTPSDESDHIVRVLDAGVFEGVPWILMELLDGVTLTQHVEQCGPLSLEEFADVFRQLCHGLAAAHRNGVVHRDIKPDNVFLQRPRSAKRGRVVKVLDFGVAKILQPSQSHGKASVIVGSAGWWAPEQMCGATISPATDVWALGLLAYWCLTGKMYHDGSAPMDATASTCAWQQGAGGRIPPALDPWFARCLASDPTWRFSHAEEAWQALEALLPSCGCSTPYVPTVPTGPSVPPAMASPAGAYVPTVPTGPSVPPAMASPARPSHGTWRTLWLGGVGGMGLVFGVGLGVRWFTTEDPTTPRGTAPVATSPQPAPTARRTVSNELPLSTNPGVEAFLRDWNAQLDATALGQPSNLQSFYAEQTRLRGSRGLLRTRAAVEGYWRAFFLEQQGTIRFDWPRATVVVEPLDGTRESHSACRLVWTEDLTVTLVRVPAVEDNPQSGIDTVDGTRCTHIEGTYLLRLMHVATTWQICHDTWSLEEAICPSCPSARSCRM